ncbi:MAG: helix-turn-helix domain-containing protein [Acidimicrobiia bacterium]
MDRPLPPDVVELLDRLESVLQLEILLALHDAREELTLGQLARRTGGSEEQVAGCLDALVGQGLADRHDGARSSYKAGGADPTVDRLAELYITEKVGVVSELLRAP